MAQDADFRRACLLAEYEDTFREEMRLKAEELKLMRRRKALAISLESGVVVDSPKLHIL